LEGTSVDHLVQTPLPKQGHLEQVAQDLIQVGFEYLQRRRNHSLSGQTVPVLCHPQSEEEECKWIVKTKISSGWNLSHPIV